jgi:protein-disulfide isomerase
MTNTTSASRIPLYLLLIGGALLAAVGSYFYLSQRSGAQGAEPPAAAAQQADAAIAKAGMNGDDRKATEAIVRAYILEHPEIITEAVAILQGRETAGRLSSIGPALTAAFAGDAAGNPKGDVTVAMFTDYNCGYCRSSVADVERLIGADKNIKLVYREVPILDQSSRDAALWALAAAKQGKHDAFHKAMFAGGKPGADSIRIAAQTAGMNISAAQAFTASDEAKAELESNLAMMQKIGFGGTPTFIIGDKILEGAQGYDRLKEAVDTARKSL